ncbi:ovarian-specific serine/threonine-protein kinase Lok-like [Microplitis mediator]|uniref:ovarian-specific serine/threonine-protein kinase Lok-like n=1 Tax=Microplitis mediator TaxID=375433 RepID=UPI0025563F05|nr:ovarian-specific serine/threonine-protein kinase Lok-like [Microplitis mediator]
MYEPDDIDMPLSSSSLPDTQPADFLTQTQSQDVNSQPQPLGIWGQLNPTRRSSKPDLYNAAIINLSKDVYTLGRNLDCDISFSEDKKTDDHKSMKYYQIISKIHCIITREVINNNNDVVIFIQDKSSNGTYVNRKLVGKDNKIALDHEDIIAFAKPENTVYTFISLKAYETSGLPDTLKSKYISLKTLGSGACGIVRMVFSKQLNKSFAIKAISKKTSVVAQSSPFDDPDRIMNEVKILQALKNPFIIKMAEIIDTPSNLFIVLELMEGGELFDRIRASSGLSEQQSKFIICQITHAVNYLHNHGITHRDLKPENILLANNDDYPLVKVSDFGLSKFVDAQTFMKTFCGTPMYVAPEILKTSGRGAYTNQVDVWSLGVILYVTLSGYVPFITDSKESLQEQIVQGNYRFPQNKFARVSSAAVKLIKSMMTVDPVKRLTIKQVMTDPWLQDREIRMRIHKLINDYNSENESPNIPSARERQLQRHEQLQVQRLQCLQRQQVQLQEVQQQRQILIRHQEQTDEDEMSNSFDQVRHIDKKPRFE